MDESFTSRTILTLTLPEDSLSLRHSFASDDTMDSVLRVLQASCAVEIEAGDLTVVDVTTHPPRRLGLAGDIAASTLFAQGLWPSARLEFVRPERGGRWTIHVKRVRDPDQTFTLQLDSSTPLRTLHAEVAAAVDAPSSVRVVFGGRILDHGDASLSSAGLRPGATVFCVEPPGQTPTQVIAKRAQEREERQAAMTEAAPRTPPQPPEGQGPLPSHSPPLPEEDQPSGEAEPSAPETPPSIPTCRICYGDASTGRLFSPCRCSGSLRYVHVGCLNHWRRVSSSRSSYFRCDACGYEYRIARTAIAKALESDTTVVVATCCLLLVVLVATSTLAAITVPRDLRLRLLDRAYRPKVMDVVGSVIPASLEAQFQSILDFLLCGGYVLGTCGVLDYLRLEWNHRHVRRIWLPGGVGGHHMPAMVFTVAWFASIRGEAFWRVVLLVGILLVGHATFIAASLYGRRLAQEFGERILEVT